MKTMVVSSPSEGRLDGETRGLEPRRTKSDTRKAHAAQKWQRGTKKATGKFTGKQYQKSPGKDAQNLSKKQKSEGKIRGGRREKSYMDG